MTTVPAPATLSPADEAAFMAKIENPTDNSLGSCAFTKAIKCFHSICVSSDAANTLFYIAALVRVLTLSSIVVPAGQSMHGDLLPLCAHASELEKDAWPTESSLSVSGFALQFDIAVQGALLRCTQKEKFEKNRSLFIDASHSVLTRHRALLSREQCRAHRPDNADEVVRLRALLDLLYSSNDHDARHFLLNSTGRLLGTYPRSPPSTTTSQGPHPNKVAARSPTKRTLPSPWADPSANSAS